MTNLGYAFNWLKNSAFGKIQLLEFEECTDFPQEFASASAAISSEELCGAKYKIILPLGASVNKGVNYYFLCEETFVTNPPARRLVTLAVNEFDGNYSVVKESIREVL